MSRLGEKFITKEGYEIEIVEYLSATNCTIQFKSGLLLKNRKYSDIKKLGIKNPQHPSVYEIGYIGVGEYLSKVNGKDTKEYKTWHGILERCYSKKRHEARPTYKDVTVCEEWLNFQNFAQWFEDNYNPETMQGWHLDKDIICPDCKIYSPETCCFVPQEINAFFTKKLFTKGVYRYNKSEKFFFKEHSKGKLKSFKIFNTFDEALTASIKSKENYIKKLADKWKHFIGSKLYHAMYSYKI